MESSPGQTQLFFSAWHNGAGRARPERFYHALTALRQPPPQQPPPAPAAPSPFDGPEAFRLLFASLLEDSRPDAIACALRRLYPNERTYNDVRSAGLGMFDNDLVVWLSDAVACGKLSRDDAMAAADDAQGALSLVYRVAGTMIPSQPLHQAAFAGGAQQAADFGRQRRVYVNTVTDEDGQDYATTTAYGMLGSRMRAPRARARRSRHRLPRRMCSRAACPTLRQPRSRHP